MKLPENYILAENTAASMLRGQNLTPISNGHMYAVAQNVMGYFQQGETLTNPAGLYDEEAALPLIAAARTLQALLKGQQKRGVEPLVIHRTSLLTSCAYAMAGNLPSAAAVQREINLFDLAGIAEPMSAAICNPACLPEILAQKDIVPAAREWLENLNRFLITGEPESEELLQPALEMLALECVDMFDFALLSSARIALAHVIHLSVAKATHRTTPFMRAFAARLIEARRPCLLPPQYELLVRDEFASRHQNGIVTLPTSGGKTLIAEFAIAKALEAGPGLAIYVAPYVALGNQVVEALRSHFRSSARVHALFGRLQSGGRHHSRLDAGDYSGHA